MTHKALSRIFLFSINFLSLSSRFSLSLSLFVGFFVVEIYVYATAYLRSGRYATDRALN